MTGIASPSTFEVFQEPRAADRDAARIDLSDSMI